MSLTHKQGFAIDVSNMNPASEAQIRASRAEIEICKGTEGTSFKDDTLPTHRAIAKHLALVFGSYTFLRPDSTGSEADYYLEYAKPEKGDLQPIIDSETFSGVFRHTTGIEALALRTQSCAAVFAKKGFEPLVYAGPYTWPQMVKYAPELKRYRVWEAQYPGPTAWSARVAHLRMQIAGAHVVMWQYTDRKPVLGRGFDFSRVRVPVAELVIK